MLQKGDKVEYDGVQTVCECDEFKFLGSGPSVVVLEGFDGWINAELPKKLNH
ncbi:hypothetical protein [Sporosarcina sp. OR05]|uniref:hypothetical protein n=1 Tax=Sporosarcina sp. OR05 TaxID=2969819 RepID=UPI003529E2A6